MVPDPVSVDRATLQFFYELPKSFSCLSLSQCECIWNSVLRFSRHWSLRDQRCGFYTFGSPSYMDAVHSLDFYLCRAAQFNCFVKQVFYCLSSPLLKSLSSCCAVKEDLVLPLPFASIPGFHIFAPASQPDQALSSSFHQDRQYELITPLIENILCDERQKSIDLISFTLPIKVPPSGAGLCCYERSGSLSRFAYALGEIVVHCGQTLHKIDDGYPYHDGALRVTLQGHAVITASGKLYYYW